MELGIPVVIAVNMMDAVEKRGDSIDTVQLGEKLGCEVVGISALKGTGIRKVAEKAVAAARAKKAFQQVHSFCEAVEEVITRVEELIPETEEAQKRFLAIRLLEKDEKMDELMKDPPDVSGLSEQLETEFEDYG